MNVRLLTLTVPLSLGILACGAALFFMANRVEQDREQGPEGAGGLVLWPKEHHPVSSEMKNSAEKLRRKQAPTFQLQNWDGKTVTIGGPRAKPQFLIFVMDGCPCSVDAEPLFQKLYKRFEGKVEFLAVTDGTPEMAKKWSFHMLMPYPLASNPKTDVMAAFGADQSAYSVLLDREGAIVKLWPGYSQGILQEMNRLMAQEAGVEAQPFDAQYAPKEPLSGCRFSSREENLRKLVKPDVG
jgi:peroxiredoxin